MTLAFDDRYKLYQPVVSTTNFNIDFPLFDVDDIEIIVDGFVVLLFSITATFIDGRSDNGVVILNSAVSNVDVEIYGKRDPRRENSYLAGDPKLADNLQRDIEATTAVQQEQKRDFIRSLRFPVDAAANYEIFDDAVARASGFLAFNTGGDPIIVSAVLSGVPVTPWSTSLLDDGNAFSGRDTLLISDMVLVKSVNYTLTAADRGKVIVFTATATLSLLAAASAQDGYSCTIIVENGAVLTIDPSGSETINGVTTSTMLGGDSGKLGSDGSEWRLGGAPVGAMVVEKSGAYTAVASDRGKTIVVTATMTLTMLAAATAGDGYYVDIIVEDGAILTIDGDGSETVNALATFKMYGGERARLITDASEWHLGGLGSGPVVIETVTPSAGVDSTIDLTNTNSDRFRWYTARMNDLTAGYSGFLGVRFSANGGGAWEATLYNSVLSEDYSDGTTHGNNRDGGVSETYGKVINGFILQTISQACGDLLISRMHDAANTLMNGRSQYVLGSNERVSTFGVRHVSATAMNAIQLRTSGGTFAAGSVTLIGHP